MSKNNIVSQPSFSGHLSIILQMIQTLQKA